MNKLSFILIAFFVIVSCNDSGEVQTESFGENKSAGQVLQCSCNELTENAKGLLLKDGKVYTGNCILTYKGSDAKYIEKQIVDGRINGKIIYYDRAGEVIFEEKYEMGTHQLDLSVENIECKCAELERKKRDGIEKFYYKDQLFRGVCHNDFPDTKQPYIEISYKNGVRDGFTTYYNKLGAILYTEKYESGKLVKVIQGQKGN